MNIAQLLLIALFYFIQLLVLAYLVQPFILLLLSASLRKRGPQRTSIQQVCKQNHFGIIITAHQDLSLIPPLLDSILQQTHKTFTVFLVADDCNGADLPVYEDGRIRIVVPPFPLNNKTGSINFALSHFTEALEIMLILDPDNLLHPQALERLNRYYNNGAQVVQGSLHAKNTHNMYERLDSLGMAFNNFVDRDARAVLNLSSNIMGSGISLRTAVYHKIRYTTRTLRGGFDKYMQAILVKTVPRITYAPDVIIYDEKVSDGKTMQRQRIRWVNSYIKFFPEALSVFGYGLKKGSMNISYFGFNLIRPPYSVLMLLLVVFLVVDAFFFSSIFWPAMICAGLFFMGFFLILSHKKERAIEGLFMAPVFFYHQVLAFCNLRLNKKSFLKTPNHKVVYVEDLLKK